MLIANQTSLVTGNRIDNLRDKSITVSKNQNQTGNNNGCYKMR